MNKFYETLKQIEENPGLYIGKPSQLRLHQFIIGYFACVSQHDLENETRWFDAFMPFVQEKYEDMYRAHWDTLIKLNSESDSDGYYKFFELFNEFVGTIDASKLM